MRRSFSKLLCLLGLPLTILLAGCGSTSSGSFTLSANSSVTLAQGASESITVSATGANSFQGAVSVAASGLPAGVTLSPANATISPGSSAKFTLTASSTAAVGTSTVTFTGMSGSLSASTTVSLTVTAASAPSGPTPDFVMSVSPASLTLAAGASGQVTVSSTGVNGFSGNIDVTLGGLPAGVTSSPSTITLTPGTPVAVTLTADTTVTTTSTPATVTFLGSSGTLSHRTTLALSLTGTGTPGSGGSFQLAVNPPTLSLTSGGATVVVDASITAQNGFNSPVTVAVSGLPSGVSVDQSSYSVTAGTAQAFRFTADATAAAGTTNVTFTGISGSLTQTVTLPLTVVTPQAAPGFTLALAPASATAAPGSVAMTTISATPVNGYNGTIAVSASNLPAGVTLSPSSFNLTTSTPVPLSLNIDASAVAGMYNVVFTGTSGSLSNVVAFALTITKASSTPDFSLALAPSTLTIAQGAVGQSSLTATAMNGFTGQISVTTSALPGGVSMSPSPVTLTTGTSQTLSFTVASNATPGTYSVVLTGTAAGNLTHAITLTLTISQVGTGDFALSVAPATLPVTQGSSGTVTLSATASGGFTGPIQVTSSAVPAGVVLTPSSFNLTPGTPVVITVGVASTVRTGTYTISFTGTGANGTLSHTAGFTLTVNSSTPGSDFMIAATPNATSVAQGDQSGLVEISVTGVNNFNGNVAFSVSGLPAGVTVAPQSGSLLAGQQEPIIFNAANNAAIGTYTITITGISGSQTHTATVALSVTAPAPPDTVTFSFSPSSVTVPVGSTADVLVTANGTSGYTGPIQVTISGLPDGVTVSPASPTTLNAGTAQLFVLTAGATAQPGSSNLTFTGQINSVTGTATLPLLVTQQGASGFDVTTWHYDDGRTGLNAFETKLTPANVKSATFGKLSTDAADATVDAQPLYVSNLTIAGQAHNVLYVTTENDTVYAYDADNGTTLWQVSALGANETASDDHGCSEVSPKIGITATPVIDRSYPQNGAMFLVAMTKDSSGNYHQRLHALDLTTGAELSSSPVEIAATYTPASGVTSTFDPSLYVERAALLLNNGSIYLTWAAPCQQTTFDYGSWVMAYSEANLQQQSVLDLTPNGSGGAIWMSGAGPAGDTDGNVFLITSKGTFDTTQTKGFPANGDYGNAYVKIQVQNGAMSVFEYFEPMNGVPGSGNYQDQGSGGLILVPDIPQTNVPLSILVGAGRDGNIYEVYRKGSYMGGYAGGVSDNNYVTVTGGLNNGATSTPATFNAYFYYGGIGDVVKSFDPTDPSGSILDQGRVTLGSAGGTPVITANGTGSAVLWLLDTGASNGPVLHAFDPNNLSTEFYNSTQAQTNGAPRDTVDVTPKYAVPMVVNGKVYIGTTTGVDIFGLLP